MVDSHPASCPDDPEHRAQMFAECGLEPRGVRCSIADDMRPFEHLARRRSKEAIVAPLAVRENAANEHVGGVMPRRRDRLRDELYPQQAASSVVRRAPTMLE